MPTGSTRGSGSPGPPPKRGLDRRQRRVTSKRRAAGLRLRAADPLSVANRQIRQPDDVPRSSGALAHRRLAYRHGAARSSRYSCSSPSSCWDSSASSPDSRTTPCSSTTPRWTERGGEMARRRRQASPAAPPHPHRPVAARAWSGPPRPAERRRQRNARPLGRAPRSVRAGPLPRHASRSPRADRGSSLAVTSSLLSPARGSTASRTSQGWFGPLAGPSCSGNLRGFRSSRGVGPSEKRA
jgi:hypothetical protein